MQLTLLCAGLLTLFTAAVHLFAGQSSIVRPFLAAEVTAIPRWTMFACWHWVSLDLLIAGVVLVGLSLSPASAAAAMVERLIAAHFTAYGVLFLGITLARPWPRRLLQLPQWLLLLPIAALVWV